MEYPNLKAEMARAGITAGEVAKQVGVSENTFSRWMNGKTDPDLGQAKKIAKVLNSSLDYLFA